MITQLISINETLRTSVVLAAGNENLLWVVCNVCGKDWEYKSFSAICTDHLDAVLASTNKRLEDSLHAVVIQLPVCL